MSTLSSIFSLPLTSPIPTFSLILLIIITSWILFKKYKIPNIISLIILGIIVGPYGLNLLHQSSAIKLFSTIGLLYIMFIAGLELDINEFKRYRHKSFTFGGLTFTIPLLIGFPICYYILGYGMSASLLISIMFSTHTLVAYPIVSRLGIAKDQAVAITVGGTIITDTVVLIILAIIVNHSEGDHDYFFWIKLILSIFVFGIIMFKLVPFVTRWFFTHFEDEKYAHYVFLLTVVFLASLLAQAVGLASIIGAFFAGLTLNRFVSHNKLLMSQVEFIGNALFIPFFLISVGMIVNLHIVFTDIRTITIAILLTIIALVGKWLAALFTQRIFHYSPIQRNLIFGLSSSHAAATLAIILVGFQAGIIGDYILNGTILLILITCMVASSVTELAANQMVDDQAQK